MNNLFPENSYMGKCSCGKEFIAPKGVIHCHNCLYAKIAELEKVNDTLHKLMTSGESRGVAKATEEFKERIAELEKERDIVAIQLLYGVNHDSITMQKMKINFEAHNLEQQAKGVEEFVERYCGTSIELEHEAIRVCAAQQAKQLREGGE